MTNSSKLDSILNKKHFRLTYHAVKWAVEYVIVFIGGLSFGQNLADAMKND